MLHLQSSPSQLLVIPSFMLLELKILGVILIPLFLSLLTSNCQANMLGIESNYYLTIFTANSLVHKMSLHTSRLFHRQLNPMPLQPFLPPFPLQTFLNQAKWYWCKATHNLHVWNSPSLNSDLIYLHFSHHLLPSSRHMAYLLFDHAKHAPDLGPLHWLFALASQWGLRWLPY